MRGRPIRTSTGPGSTISATPRSRPPRADLAKESATVETVFSKTRRTDFDEPAIAAAWTRISSLLSTGRGIDDVIARDGFSRDEAEALRRNYSTFIAATDPRLRPRDVERRTAPDLQRVMAAEGKLMPTAEAEATSAELERLRVGDVLQSIDRMAVEAAQQGKVSGLSMLQVGFRQRTAEIEPEPESWKSIISRIDSGAAAMASRNSLSPDLRAGLNSNAQDVSFRQPAGVEPEG